MGVLIVGPALLTLLFIKKESIGLMSRKESVIAWIGLIVLSLLTNTPLSLFPVELPPMLPFLFVIWLALRQNAIHAAWAVITLSATAIWGVLAQTGPFVGESLDIDLPGLWAYLFTLGISSLLITALRAESTNALGESRRREGLLKEAQRIAHIGNWELNIENNALRWSDETHRIFGLSREEFGATYDASWRLYIQMTGSSLIVPITNQWRTRPPTKLNT